MPGVSAAGRRQIPTASATCTRPPPPTAAGDECPSLLSVRPPTVEPIQWPYSHHAALVQIEARRALIPAAAPLFPQATPSRPPFAMMATNSDPRRMAQ